MQLEKHACAQTWYDALSHCSPSCPPPALSKRQCTESLLQQHRTHRPHSAASFAVISSRVGSNILPYQDCKINQCLSIRATPRAGCIFLAELEVPHRISLPPKGNAVLSAARHVRALSVRQASWTGTKLTTARWLSL